MKSITAADSFRLTHIARERRKHNKRQLLPFPFPPEHVQILCRPFRRRIRPPSHFARAPRTTARRAKLSRVTAGGFIVGRERKAPECRIRRRVPGIKFAGAISSLVRMRARYFRPRRRALQRLTYILRRRRRISSSLKRGQWLRIGPRRKGKVVHGALAPEIHNSEPSGPENRQFILSAERRLCGRTMHYNIRR